MGRPGVWTAVNSWKEENVLFNVNSIYVSEHICTVSLGIYQTLCLASALLKGNKEKRNFVYFLNSEGKKRKNISHRKCQ